MMISLGFFLIFSNFWFFWLLRGRRGGVKGQKKVQNEKKICLWRSISQESYIIWFWFILLMCKMTRVSRSFLHFFKILNFWIIRGVKRQKIAQNDKKFCLSHLKSQEPYMIWFSFVVYNCKLIIYVGIFFIFQNFDFFGLLGGSKRKNGLK